MTILSSNIENIRLINLSYQQWHFLNFRHVLFRLRVHHASCQKDWNEDPAMGTPVKGCQRHGAQWHACPQEVLQDHQQSSWVHPPTPFFFFFFSKERKKKKKRKKESRRRRRRKKKVSKKRWRKKWTRRAVTTPTGKQGVTLFERKTTTSFQEKGDFVQKKKRMRILFFLFASNSKENIFPWDYYVLKKKY